MPRTVQVCSCPPSLIIHRVPSVSKASHFRCCFMWSPIQHKQAHMCPHMHMHTCACACAHTHTRTHSHSPQGRGALEAPLEFFLSLPCHPPHPHAQLGRPVLKITPCDSHRLPQPGAWQDPLAVLGQAPAPGCGHAIALRPWPPSAVPVGSTLDSERG